MRNFINVVIFLLGLLALASPVSAKDIYYCATDELTGFDPTENYKRYSYNNKRFNVEVDFENQTMKSEKISMQDEVKCTLDVYRNTLYCVSQYGHTLAFHKKTLKFHHSSMYLDHNFKDDIYIEHGSFEKF